MWTLHTCVGQQFCMLNKCKLKLCNLLVTCIYHIIKYHSHIYLKHYGKCMAAKLLAKAASLYHVAKLCHCYNSFKLKVSYAMCINTTHLWCSLSLVLITLACLATYKSYTASAHTTDLLLT